MAKSFVNRKDELQEWIDSSEAGRVDVDDLCIGKKPLVTSCAVPESQAELFRA